ncbi:MarR family transcriptional regulator [Streptomyces sp. NBC_00335]|uniref:MarR family winged helix-turn-helix transcriptional regulator n=1 Tax=unclassified Streptomyces TaxID=2593676 RepID=UPI00225B5807|nr:MULTISPECIES: MarR family transcriptional regulator [unclassified Streptomyces]MCX5408863.1 MarR family transcriptional regulator [Streptomyces sp. NBC_00086]
MSTASETDSVRTAESTDGTDSAGTTDTTDGVLAEQLLRLTRRLHRIQKRHLEPLGITPAQSRLLRTVAHLSTVRPPRMADLAARLEVVPRAVTTLVDGLESADCVRRVPDPENRRVIRIELTDTGRATLRRLRNARTGAAEEILAPLTADQREVLGGLLNALADAPAEHGC